MSDRQQLRAPHIARRALHASLAGCWQVISGSVAMPTATVRLRGPDGIDRTATGMGVGPVDAAFKAIDELVRVQVGTHRPAVWVSGRMCRPCFFTCRQSLLSHQQLMLNHSETGLQVVAVMIAHAKRRAVKARSWQKLSAHVCKLRGCDFLYPVVETDPMLSVAKSGSSA